jgi:hypothetical protein
LCLLFVNLTVNVCFAPAFWAAVSLTDRLCRFPSSRFPVALSDTVTVFVFPAASLTVVLPSTTVRLLFFGLRFDALTATTLWPESVSVTDSVNVTEHELPAAPAHDTDAPADVPEVVGLETFALGLGAGGTLLLTETLAVPWLEPCSPSPE